MANMGFMKQGKPTTPRMPKQAALPKQAPLPKQLAQPKLAKVAIIPAPKAFKPAKTYGSGPMKGLSRR